MNKTVERTFAILQLIANSKHGITLQEIANELGIAKSSAFVIVHSLLELNYVKTMENNDKKYCLGVETFSLGMKYTNDLDLIQQCTNHLPALAEKYNKTAFLGILNDCNIVYLYKYVAKNARLATCAIGSSKPAYATALGKAIMAFLPEQEQLHLAEKIQFDELTTQTIRSKEQLLHELALTKQRGYSIERQELERLTFCCGAPIFDYKKNVIAAISLSDLAIENDNEEQMANDLKAVATEISKIIGYTFS